MKQSELAAGLAGITTQLGKIAAESAATLQRVADLQEVIESMENVTPELQGAFDALKAQAQVVDDLVPDAAPEAPAG